MLAKQHLGRPHPNHDSPIGRVAWIGFRPDPAIVPELRKKNITIRIIGPDIYSVSEDDTATLLSGHLWARDPIELIAFPLGPTSEFDTVSVEQALVEAANREADVLILSSILGDMIVANTELHRRLASLVSRGVLPIIVLPEEPSFQLPAGVLAFRLRASKESSGRFQLSLFGKQMMATALPEMSDDATQSMSSRLRSAALLTAVNLALLPATGDWPALDRTAFLACSASRTTVTSELSTAQPAETLLFERIFAWSARLKEVKSDLRREDFPDNLKEEYGNFFLLLNDWTLIRHLCALEILYRGTLTQLSSLSPIPRAISVMHIRESRASWLSVAQGALERFSGHEVPALFVSIAPAAGTRVYPQEQQIMRHGVRNDGPSQQD